MAEQEVAVHQVTVAVNEKAVTLQSNRVTGIQIKQAAMSQGVPIQPDFILSEELGERKTRIIGDADVVTVNQNSRFLAIPPDDNS